MKLKYDPKNDVLYFRLDDSVVVESQEVEPGVILDYDNEQNVIGFELLNAGQRTSRKALLNLHFETS